MVSENASLMEVAQEQPLHIHIEEAKQLTPLPSPAEGMVMEATVASAVASEKARLRAQNALLDRWVSESGNNLYPSRDEKERLGKQMNMPYAQVNRWFANRRRKQTKRTKIVNSPVSLPRGASASRSGSPQSSVSIVEPAVINAFLTAFAAQPGKCSEDKREMVVQHGNDTPLTPPADDIQMPFHQQVVPEMSQAANEAVILQKLLAAMSPQQGMNGQFQFNPAMLALLAQPYAAQLQMLQHAQALQQHMLQQQMAAALAAQQQQHQHQQQQQQPVWAHHVSSISASPAQISDSEVSDLSELSPRPHSPPFKDGHQLADQNMLALMDLSKLSENEQLAVNILMELHTEVR